MINTSNQKFIKNTPPAQFDEFQFEDAIDGPIPASANRDRAITATDRSHKLNGTRSSSSLSSPTSSSNVSCGISSGDRNENDVLLGRGKGPNNYIGNKRFRNLVSQYQPIYFESKRSDKLAIAKSVSELVRQQEPAGRFLRWNSRTDTWVEVSEQDAIKKTAQLLREGIPQRQKKRKTSLVSPNISNRSSPNIGPLKMRRADIQVMDTLHLQRLPESHVLAVPSMVVARDMNNEYLPSTHQSSHVVHPRLADIILQQQLLQRQQLNRITPVFI